MKGDRARALYGAAWKLVHFFMNGPDPGYRQRFTAFSQRLEGEALARDPGSPEVRFRRAVFFICEERLADADRELTRALAARPDEPRYLHARLRWYEARRGQQEDTGKVVDVPAELPERLARTARTGAQLAKAGWFTAPVGRSEEGLRRVERAIALDPLCYSCEETRAAMLANRGRTEDAMAAIDRAIAIWPEALPMDGILELRKRIRHLTAP